MNLHSLSFEQLLEISASLEDPREIREMTSALERLEKNLRYMRQRLNGKLLEAERRAEETRREERKKRKKSLKVFTSKKTDPPGGKPNQ